MNLIFTILGAFFLDIVFGDPRYRFHPVILIGKLARLLERKLNSGSNRFLKGIVCSLIVYTAVFLLVLTLRYLFSQFKYPLILDSILLYTVFALRSLNEHAIVVRDDLEREDLTSARKDLSFIVGRKTSQLDETEICRGVIETVSENLVDGVTAPLFYAFIFGIEGAFLYKAVNTLDSLWGHRNQRFEQFGKFAARVDDVMNYIPARLTAPIIALSSYPITGNLKHAFRVLVRDGRKHPSPNSGLSEAAMAGALGVQLGGENSYEGYKSVREHLGVQLTPLSYKKVTQALWIINLSSVVFLGIMILIRIQFPVVP